MKNCSFRGGKIPKIENIEKKSWSDNHDEVDNPTRMRRPFRLTCLGPPGSGKSNYTKWIACQYGDWHTAVVWSPSEGTGEWADLDATEYVSECPDEQDPVFGTIDEPSLFIVDDIFIAGLKGEPRRRLDKMCSWASTHRNISVCIVAQGVWQVDINVRRYMNAWAIWPIADQTAVNRLASSTSLDSKTLRRMLNDVKKHGPHANLCIQWTGALGPEWAVTVNGRYPLKYGR